MRMGGGRSGDERGGLGHWGPTRERDEKGLLVLLS